MHFHSLCFLLLQPHEGLVPGKQLCSPAQCWDAHRCTSHTSLPHSLQPGQQLPQTISLPSIAAPAQQRFLWGVTASKPQSRGDPREMLQWEMRLLRARSWYGREGELAHAGFPPLQLAPGSCLASPLGSCLPQCVLTWKSLRSEPGLGASGGRLGTNSVTYMNVGRSWTSAVGLMESLCLSQSALGHPQRFQTHPWGSELWTGVRPQTQTSCPTLHPPPWSCAACCQAFEELEQPLCRGKAGLGNVPSGHGHVRRPALLPATSTSPLPLHHTRLLSILWDGSYEEALDWRVLVRPR